MRPEVDRLFRYFTDGAIELRSERLVGAEIETSFVDSKGFPITLNTSQCVFGEMLRRHHWNILGKKGDIISTIVSPDGKDKILYELGRQNIEVSTTALPAGRIIEHTQGLLERLHKASARIGALPRYKPIIKTKESLLVIPDQRDATWLTLDGRDALELLAKCSAVQFTVDVNPSEAIPLLNNLGRNIGAFLADYPQEVLWREYIHNSKAGYLPLRYGGPLFFKDLAAYCRELAKHDVVQGSALVPHKKVEDLDIPLFLRSVWWYFRLRRYGPRLCIEVRPLARRTDAHIQSQFDLVMDILFH